MPANIKSLSLLIVWLVNDDRVITMA